MKVKLVRKPISLGICPVNLFSFKSKRAAQKRKEWMDKQANK
jgi:hypothetical protein